MTQYDTDLDEINKYYRYKIVTILTVPTIINPLSADKIPLFCTGFFLKANESGVWILHHDKNTRDFFYHDKIIKIEEALILDPDTISEEQKNILDKEFKTYDSKRREENKEIYSKREDAPDVVDPSDQKSVMSMLEKVQHMVRESKVQKEGNFLDQRKPSG